MEEDMDNLELDMKEPDMSVSDIIEPVMWVPGECATRFLLSWSHKNSDSDNLALRKKFHFQCLLKNYFFKLLF